MDQALKELAEKISSKILGENITIDNVDYNYIDLLAIVQVIKSESGEAEAKPKKTRRKKDTE